MMKGCLLSRKVKLLRNLMDLKVLALTSVSQTCKTNQSPLKFTPGRLP